VRRQLLVQVRLEPQPVRWPDVTVHERDVDVPTVAPPPGREAVVQLGDGVPVPRAQVGVPPAAQAAEQTDAVRRVRSCPAPNASNTCGAR